MNVNLVSPMCGHCPGGAHVALAAHSTPIAPMCGHCPGGLHPASAHSLDASDADRAEAARGVDLLA